MATLEPQHYWPGDKIGPTAAKPVDKAVTDPLPGQHITPFEMNDGPGLGMNSDYLFETRFFEVNPSGERGPKETQAPALDPETTRQSLGE